MPPLLRVRSIDTLFKPLIAVRRKSTLRVHTMTSLR